MNRFNTLRILVVEDNETSREIVVEQLNSFNLQIDAVANGVLALELWRSKSYSLVITDLQMPEMDGWQLAREIRKYEAGAKKQTPIIALTASIIKEELERCQAAGINDCIAKPTDLESLRVALEKWTISNLAKPEISPTVQYLNEFKDVMIDPEVDLPIWERDALKKMVGNDQVAYEGFLNKFLKRLETQAENLLKLTSSDDLASAGKIAHSLKTTSRSIGAMQLGMLCEQIELAAHNNETSVYDNKIEQFKTALQNLQKVIRESQNKAS